MKVHPECQGIATTEAWRGRRTSEDEQSVMRCVRPCQLQALVTAISMQTVLTVKDLENLENSEAQHVMEKEELQQKHTQLEQDNMRLRAEKEGLKEKMTLLNYDFFMDDNDSGVGR